LIQAGRKEATLVLIVIYTYPLHKGHPTPGFHLFQASDNMTPNIQTKNSVGHMGVILLQITKMFNQLATWMSLWCLSK
jgi:hypothetical protein